MTIVADSQTKRQPGFVEGLILGTTLDRAPTLLPGVALALVIVAVAAILTGLINAALGFDGVISFIMVAIVLGILVRNTVGFDARFLPGIEFSVKKLLRLGIILLGVRLSLPDVLEIGGFGLPIVIGAVATGLAVATAAARRLGLSDRLGTLIAIGTGICGATAIVAAAPGLKAREEEVIYAVANITVFGIAAMLLYPFLGNLVFNGDVVSTGLFLGTSIHETAQVAGAGLIYDQSFNVTATPSVADVAVVAKLVRNVLMLLVIPGVTYVYAKSLDKDERDGGTRTRIRDMFPVFIIGFLIMAAFRSIGDAGIESSGSAYGLWDTAAWGDLIHRIKSLAEYLLATAMAAVGLGTSIRRLRGLGLKPFVVGIAAAVSVGVVSIGLVLLFGSQISV